MPTPRRRTEDAEQILPMAEYQSYLNQADAWPHIEDDGKSLTPVPIDELHHARAVNALHKLRRWQDKLYEGATNAMYEEARLTLMASPLVAALIEQALGEFYTGTYLKTTTAVAHVDDLVQQGADNLERILSRSAGITARLSVEEHILEASIDGAVALDRMREETLGRRARVLADIIATAIATEGA